MVHVKEMITSVIKFEELYRLYLCTGVDIIWFDTERRFEATPTEDTDSSDKARIFTFRELATATKNFRDETFIGQGGFGTVYKGKLDNMSQV